VELQVRTEEEEEALLAQEEQVAQQALPLQAAAQL
jgi:hypothetical protein